VSEAHNSAAGTILEMTFELDDFDEERLGQLREIARRTI
jgi:hypothetical protein